MKYIRYILGILGRIYASLQQNIQYENGLVQVGGKTCAIDFRLARNWSLSYRTVQNISFINWFVLLEGSADRQTLSNVTVLLWIIGSELKVAAGGIDCELIQQIKTALMSGVLQPPSCFMGCYPVRWNHFLSWIKSNPWKALKCNITKKWPAIYIAQKM